MIHPEQFVLPEEEQAEQGESQSVQVDPVKYFPDMQDKHEFWFKQFIQGVVQGKHEF